MTLVPHTLLAGLALVLFFFVALPALVTGFVSVALIRAGGERARPRPVSRLVGVFVATAATLFVLLGAAVVFVHPTVEAAPAQNTATVGGLHYAVENAWVLDPRRRVDAEVARGLPAAARRPAPDKLLYAVFVGVTNETARPLPMAPHVTLRDVTNRDYDPLRLGPGNRYAYRARTMPPQSHRPAPWTPAARDLSADGLMLVFRIPRRAYEDGPLELLVRDPVDPATAASLQVL